MNKVLSVARPTLLAAVTLGACSAGAEARIESFSPTGYTKDASQVAVRFSDAMVSLGDPDRSDPFAVRCGVPGTGRWIDERNWVYDFDYDVPGAESCRFTLRRRVRTFTGERVAGPREYRFHTGGPSVVRHAPTRRSIDERQVFLLALDADADSDSIRDHVGCRVEGRGSVGVALVEGEARREILEALEAHGYHLEALVHEARKHLPPGDEATSRDRALERIVSLRCQEDFPGGAEVNLTWGAGVAGNNGVAGESDQILAFKASAFRANVYYEYHDGWLPLPMYVWFTRPVPRELADRFRLVDAAGRPMEGQIEDSAEIRRIDFPGPFREESDYRLELTGPIHDVVGRPLANASTFPRRFRTSRLPPGITFGGGRLRVVEALDPLGVPLLVRRPSDPRIVVRQLRVDDDAALLAWLPRINAHMHGPAQYTDGWPAVETSIFQADAPTERFDLPLADPDAPFQIARAPLPGNGFHVVELTLPWEQDVIAGRYVSAGVLATGLAVHLLHGRASSIVWVTRLSDASPVPGAAIRITDPCTGEALWVGRTNESGIATVAEYLPVGDCPDFRRALLVSARTPTDFGYVLGSGRRYAGATALRVHTILDRSLFLPGQTVSMKHVVRHATPDGLGLPPGLPAAMEVVVEHAGTGETHSQTIDVDETGTALSTFELPKEVTLGHYTIEVHHGEQRHQSGQFRVENFKAQTMRATVDGPTEPLVRPSAVPVTLSVKHLAGGGAAHQEIEVRTSWHDQTAPANRVESVTAVTLDKNGEAAFVVEDLGPLATHTTLFVEFDYADANGQIATATGHFDLWPAALQLLIEDGTDAPSGVRSLRIMAFGVDGKPVSGQAVQASLFSLRDERREKRLPGGFRAWTYEPDRRHEADCSGVTDADGILECDIPRHVAEVVDVDAVARDADGNAVNAHRRIWRDDDFLTVDEFKLHLPGDHATVAVDSPFAKATALVSVHGEGVLDAFVTELEGPQSVVEVPIRRNYAPDVIVSVLAVRGREPGSKPPWLGPTGEVFDEVTGDLASYDPLGPSGPDSRHDTVLIHVAKDTHRLTVDVVPERDTYAIREAARVGIRVADPAGAPASNAEIALVAINEGLADLWPNWSWHILDMIMQRPLDSEVTTTSGLRDLRKPFAVRSLAGGADLVETAGTPRQLGNVIFDRTYQVGVNASSAPHPAPETTLRYRLDHLLLWRGRVALDKDGTAEVDIPLNDLVTSFRIVAVATAGADLFGTGEATIRTTRDLVIQAGLPPTVREGDRFDATFSVRNATESDQTVAVVAEAEGLPKLRRQSVTLPAGVSKDVSWRVAVPSGVDHLAWDVTAVSEAASDRLAARQTVVPLTPVRVQQATLGQLASPLQWSVEPPRRALRGRGGAWVSFRPTLLGGLDPMREAMARYPFTCLEQKISAAIALGDPARWSVLMANLETSMDRDGLLRFFPTTRLRGSAVLTAYVLAIADAAGRPVPEVYRERMIRGLTGYLERRIRRADDFPGTTETLVRLGVLAALARHGAANVEMLDGFDLDLELLPTSALLDWIDILGRLAPDRAQLTTAKHVLRTRLNYQGTTLGFSTESRDRLWWLMVSTDANAARAVATLVDDTDWRTDMPRMVRGLFGRQRYGRWETTVANAWGAVATARFAEVFEAEPVSGTTLVHAGQAQHRLQWPNGDAAAADRLPEPIEIPWSAAETLALRHEGRGAPWALVELRAAVPIRRAVRRGYRITRTVSPVVSETPRGWHRGDVAEVKVEVDADADMTWVVVEDPLPPGAVVLGSGLGGDSSILSPTYVRGDGWPVFTERGFDRYRAYFRFVPKGQLTLRYNVRYNTAGTFQLPPSRVEAMYAPEMHAELPIKPVTIR